jgi:hypothetical protein
MTAALNTLRDLIQEDVGQRGLRTDPDANLINACPEDFAAACRSISSHPRPAVAIVTGFFIPDANPPAGETDGPLGALFLARCFSALGIPVALLTDGFCRNALEVGLQTCGLTQTVALVELPAQAREWTQFLPAMWLPWARDRFHLTHLIAIERPGPSHTLASFRQQSREPGEGELFLQEVPPEHQDRYHTARGKDITDLHSPAHLLFESARQQLPGVATIGIGDGGNELGMGKIPWSIIRRNVPRGGLIACRVPTDFLIVCGVSNWGGYALAVGVAMLRGVSLGPDLLSVAREQQLLELMVARGPLVDGVTKRVAVSVDGLAFDAYMEPLRRMGNLAEKL